MTTENHPLRILSKAPTRIDLAGGTVDIWPLYLLLGSPSTLNLAIDLFAEATLEVLTTDGKNSGSVILRSDDQNVEARYSFSDFLAIPPLQKPAGLHPALELHYKLARHFAEGAPRRHLRLSTRALSPAGAGLGGSSALGIAIIGALASWRNIEEKALPINPLQEGEKLIEIARDVETTVIKVPAGLQDYYGAMFGGLQNLNWQAGTHRRQWLSEAIAKETAERTLLFYSGQSRNSGINNWALFKGLIDDKEGHGDIRAKFERIAAATRRLEVALLGENWPGAGEAIAEEWNARQTLAPGITTPEITAAFEEARKITQVSGKICGAGGGGCFFMFLPATLPSKLEEEKARITEAVSSDQIRALPFQPVLRGLEVQVSRS